MRTVPLIIAHRGESFDAPENTLAAFDLAWQRGDDAIELDVHTTADERVVVCHDETLERTGRQSLNISSSLWASLDSIDVGRWKDESWKGQRLPLLENVLDQMPAGKTVFVEIKPAQATADAVVRLLRTDRWRGVDVRLITFHADVARSLKQQLPHHKTYWLVETDPQESSDQPPLSPAQMIQTAVSIGANGLDIADGSWLTAKAVAEFRRARLEVYVWTVDDPARCRVLASIGVDGITTNRAAWIRSQIF